MSNPDPASPSRSSKPLAPPKTWVHAAARWAIMPLVNTPVTPNHLTTVRLVTAIMAAGAFAVGTHQADIIGGCIFIVSAFFDRADGELARVGGKTSPWGHAYDLICDVLACTLAFIGIGIGLREGPVGMWSIALGLAAGVSIGTIFWVIEKIKAAKATGEHAFPTRGGFDPDDGLFLLGPIAWMGPVALWPLLVAAAIGAPLFALWTTYRDRRLLFSKKQPASVK